MDLSSLSDTTGYRRKRKRVGRGPSSGNGKTSGRGHKGQKSRSGYARRLGFEGGQMPLNRRLPKRGFKYANRHPLMEVNLDRLEENFDDGAEVTPETIHQKHLGKHFRGGVKILGRGELSKKLTVKANAVSASARTKIEQAGGSVEIIGTPEARAKKNRKKKHQE